MNEKKRKWRGESMAAVCAGLFFALSLLPSQALALNLERTEQDQKAQTRMLVPVGKAVGVKLFAEGVLVVALSGNTETDSPARESGVKTGDIILTMNDVTIDSTEHLQSLVKENGEAEAVIGVRRNGRLCRLSIQPQRGADGVCRLGAWIRDSMAGIGTVTFYDPATGEFAALGHGVTDVDTGKLMPLSRGSIMPASVKAVKRGEHGAPGELKGDFDLTHDIGTLCANTDCGIFGTVDAESEIAVSGEAIPLAGRAQVRTGRAQILANCAGDKVCAYEIEIEKLYSGTSPTRNLLLRVTDPRLLADTGGIVQGMVVSYNRDNSGEKPLRRKALRACRIGAPVRCRRGQYGTTPFLQTG